MKEEITSEHFEKATGTPAIQDDLNRCNCEHAGEIGHWSCGWCRVCDKPFFMCSHSAPRIAPSVNITA